MKPAGVVLCLVGGFVGAAAGFVGGFFATYAVCWLITWLTGNEQTMFYMWWSLAISPVLALVGVVFGIQIAARWGSAG